MIKAARNVEPGVAVSYYFHDSVTARARKTEDGRLFVSVSTLDSVETATVDSEAAAYSFVVETIREAGEL
jgi:hypothetical protein